MNIYVDFVGAGFSIMAFHVPQEKRAGIHFGLTIGFFINYSYFVAK
jgi:hypothetical protein